MLKLKFLYFLQHGKLTFHPFISLFFMTLFKYLNEITCGNNQFFNLWKSNGTTFWYDRFTNNKVCSNKPVSMRSLYLLFSEVGNPLDGVKILKLYKVNNTSGKYFTTWSILDGHFSLNYHGVSILSPCCFPKIWKY